MNIGISTTMIQRGKSGVAQYVFALVRALLAEPGKHRLTLFVLEDDLPLFAFVEDRARIVQVSESCRSAVKNILWHQIRLPVLARQLNLDVLHVPSYRRLLWNKPCALVATIHDLAPFHVKGKYDPARMFYGRLVVRHLAQRQDRIIAISGNTAADIERFFGIPPARQRIILNGIDHSRFHPGESSSARKQASDRWGLSESFFLYVSRLEHPAKNHVRLIEAFTRFKRATGSPSLLVLGGSDWHGAEAVHSAARVSPVAKDIRFLGFVDDKDLPTLYRAAHAFVYPSLFEGFGLPPVEAMACGCPVISSTRGALEEVIGGAAATVDPEDVDDLAWQLQRVAASGMLRKELVARGLDNARRFAWDANARAVLEVYRQALAPRTFLSAQPFLGVNPP
jgi:glycosyltransferase involved in cell wall biosynthesis